MQSFCLVILCQISVLWKGLKMLELVDVVGVCSQEKKQDLL